MIIISGVELGDAHWHPRAVAELLSSRNFDRVLGSLHCLPTAKGPSELTALYSTSQAETVVRDYLDEVVELINNCDQFSILAHLDYPARYWPTSAGHFDLGRFEPEVRQTMRSLAVSGRLLEINTRRRLDPAFCVGGEKRVAKPSLSAQTRTTRVVSELTSPTLRPSPRRPATAPGATRSTSGTGPMEL